MTNHVTTASGGAGKNDRAAFGDVTTASGGAGKNDRAAFGQDTPGTTTSTIEVSEVESRVLAEVADMLRDVIGEEYIVDMEITMGTLFNADLEMESIEFVALADRMRERYGESVDFVGFLAGRDVDQVIGMEVGEVVAFIAGCLTSGDPTGAGRHGTTTSPSASGEGHDRAAFGNVTAASGGAGKNDRAAFGTGN